MQLTEIQARLQKFARPDFTFDTDAHAYALAGKPLTSWSKWIEQYAHPFPEQQAAAASASKRGITADEVLAEWQWSRDLGTLVHAWIEGWYKALYAGTMPPQLPEHPDVRLRCQKFLGLQPRLRSLVPLAMELQAHHEGAGVAGTLDFVGHHPERRGVIVTDWKTNSMKSFTRDRKVDRFTKRMRDPMAHLYETKETLYSLQNSFYRVLLEEMGIPTATGCLIHLPEGEFEAEIITATDHRALIRSLLFN